MKSFYIGPYLLRRRGCKRARFCDGKVNRDNKLEIHKPYMHRCEKCKGRYLVQIKSYLFLLLDKHLGTCEVFNFRRKDHNLVLDKDFFSTITDKTVTVSSKLNFDDRYHQLQYLEVRINNSDCTSEQCFADISVDGCHGLLYLEAQTNGIAYTPEFLVHIPSRDSYKVRIDEYWAARQARYNLYAYYNDPKKSVLNYPLQLPVETHSAVANNDVLSDRDLETTVNAELKGVMLGHGHKHDTKRFPTSIPNIAWTLVDINPDTKPDIIGGYDCMETVVKLGLHKWDYVFASYCPWKDDGIFVAARYLLNNSGQFILNNFNSRYEDDLEQQSELHVQRNHYKRYSHEDNFSIFYVT